ncbi:hypothetical protein [Terricaulis silvestris]|nr:hypothetical protein [Terricaulis silvestris]
MSAPITQPNRLPVRDSVGAALRFVRENWRFIAAAAAAGAVATTIAGALALAVPPLGIVTSLASGFIQATTYAAFTGAMLFGAAATRGRLAGDGGRVWVAMAIIAFFMMLVMVVLTIPVFMALAVGPMAPYRDDLAAAGQDRERVSAIMLQFAEANPGALLLVALFYFAVWFVLTSRLYIAAPASVDQQRILSFETWAWTKGATLRIIGARLMLLLPANIFVGALGYLIGQAVGVNTIDVVAATTAAAANPVGFLTYILISTFLTFALYSALEAGLSAAIYQRLKPPAR